MIEIPPTATVQPQEGIRTAKPGFEFIGSQEPVAFSCFPRAALCSSDGSGTPRESQDIRRRRFGRVLEQRRVDQSLVMPKIEEILNGRKNISRLLSES
jgi:hypothetical protein